MQVVRVAAVGGLLLAACGSSPEPDVAGPPAASDLPAGTDQAAPDDPEDGFSAEAAFLATVDELVAGTDYEGLVEADPQGFLEAADLVCDRFGDGAGFDEVVEEYLAAIGESRGTLTEDDGTLAGALLGASVASFCPEHADQLPQE